MEHVSRGPGQTMHIARRLAARMRGGECVALYGDLGAGKTQFVRGLVAGLGGDAQRVCSPTFVLLNIYDGGRLRVYHLDACRLRGPEDLEAIGFGELLEQGGVVAVEWADRVESLLPSQRIDVRIRTTGPRQRRISIEAAPAGDRQ